MAGRSSTSSTSEGRWQAEAAQGAALQRADERQKQHREQHFRGQKTGRSSTGSSTSEGRWQAEAAQAAVQRADGRKQKKSEQHYSRQQIGRRRRDISSRYGR